MSKFTEDEKIIAKHIDKKYKWVARDKSGNLYVYCNKPAKGISSNEWITDGGLAHIFGFEDLFKSVTWEDAEPTLIRDIYDPQILDDEERKYLTAVLRPLPKVKTIKRVEASMINSEYLMVIFRNREIMSFPFFQITCDVQGHGSWKRIHA